MPSTPLSTCSTQHMWEQVAGNRKVTFHTDLHEGGYGRTVTWTKIFEVFVTSLSKYLRYSALPDRAPLEPRSSTKMSLTSVADHVCLCVNRERRPEMRLCTRASKYMRSSLHLYKLGLIAWNSLFVLSNQPVRVISLFFISICGDGRSLFLEFWARSVYVDMLFLITALVYWLGVL